jgi:glutaminase
VGIVATKLTSRYSLPLPAEFCRRLVERYLFHVYDNIGGGRQGKKDPRLAKGEDHARDMLMLITAAVYGDLPSLQHLEARGVDLNGGDYDRRTALHLAASEGQLEVVRYLLAREVDVNPLDRWGGTPLDDAHRENRQAVAELLASHGAQSGATLLPASVELAAAPA